MLDGVLVACAELDEVDQPPSSLHPPSAGGDEDVWGEEDGHWRDLQARYPDDPLVRSCEE